VLPVQAQSRVMEQLQAQLVIEVEVEVDEHRMVEDQVGECWGVERVTGALGVVARSSRSFRTSRRPVVFASPCYSSRDPWWVVALLVWR
jgi:hypothetical protein